MRGVIAPAGPIPTSWSTKARADSADGRRAISCGTSPATRRSTASRRRLTTGSSLRRAAAAKRPLRVAAYDYGMKWNILRRFAAHGCDVRVFPATDAGERPAGDLARRRVPQQRARRSGGARLRDRQRAGARRERRADVRHLPRPPDARPRDGRADVQAQVRPPRRESSGEGPARPARSRSRRRITGSRSIRTSLPSDVEGHAPQPVRRHDRRAAPRVEAGLLRAVPPGGRARAARRGLPVQPVPRRDGTRAPDAQTHRFEAHSRHRLRPDRHRPGLRVRLLRHAGLQGAARRGPRSHSGQQQSGDDHDRPGDRGPHLRRAADGRDARADHRARAARRAAADRRRADGAQPRGRARRGGRAREATASS